MTTCSRQPCLRKGGGLSDLSCLTCKILGWGGGVICVVSEKPHQIISNRNASKGSQGEEEEDLVER